MVTIYLKLYLFYIISCFINQSILKSEIRLIFIFHSAINNMLFLSYFLYIFAVWIDRYKRYYRIKEKKLLRRSIKWKVTQNVHAAELRARVIEVQMENYTAQIATKRNLVNGLGNNQILKYFLFILNKWAKSWLKKRYNYYFFLKSDYNH